MVRRITAALCFGALLLVTGPLLAQVSPGPPPNLKDTLPPLSELLSRVGVSAQRYFSDLRSITALQTIHQVELRPDLSPENKTDTFEYQFFLLSVPPGASSSPSLNPASFREQREIFRVNGKPHPKNKLFVCPGCKSVFSTALAFLLPENQAAFLFTGPEPATLNDRSALVLSFRPAASTPPEVTVKGNRFTMDFRRAGRIWVDPESFEVLQLSFHLPAPFDFDGPRKKMRYEVSDITIRFARASFKGPDQQMLLPVSAETLDVIRGAGRPRLRSIHTFSNFQRFTSSSRIVPAKQLSELDAHMALTHAPLGLNLSPVGCKVPNSLVHFSGDRAR